MTHTTDTPIGNDGQVSENQLSRRELRRRRMLEEERTSVKKPSSIFDIEYQPDEIPRYFSAYLQEAAERDAAIQAEAQTPEPTTEAQAPESEPEPEPTSEPVPASELEPEPEPVFAPPALTQAVEATAVEKPTLVPALGQTLLLEKIPAEPIVQASAPENGLPADNKTASSELPIRRKPWAPWLAAAAVFGIVLTFALPAIGGGFIDPDAAGDGGQILTSANAVGETLDIESFESVDELEVAAEAATLRAASFTNDPTADVQYPFDVGVPLTDGFGPRSWPVAGFHDAQDFAAGYGAAVRSIAAGTVIESGTTSDGCGFGLKIQHRIDGQDVKSRYCHLAADPIVKVGDKVRVGQFVALVGSTGISVGPHLHMVIEVNGKAVDPMPFLAKYNKPKSAATGKPNDS